MNETFKKFCQEIEFEPTEEFYGVEIEQVSREGNYYLVYFNFRDIVKISLFRQFYSKVRKAKLNFEIKIKYFDDSKKEFLVKDYFEYAFLLVNNLFDFFENKNYEFSKSNILTIFVRNELDAKIEKLNQIETYMQNWGFENFKVEFKIDEEKEKEAQKLRIEEMFKEEKMKQDFLKSVKQTENSNNIGFKKDFTSFMKNKSYTPLSIKEALESEEFNVIVTGEIFKRDVQKTKTGLWITILTITDYEEAIKVKIFSKTDQEKEEQEKYVVGKTITAYGSNTKDEYLKTKVISAKKIEFIELKKDERIDKEKETRVEFYARSNMNAMDGISTAEEYVLAAKKFNHSAIGIADVDSVQSFPEFYHSAKKHKIKAIYGSTFNTIEYKNNAVINAKKDSLLKNAKYVVFDLETTGLSPRYDEIIEFGAVVIEHGKIKENIQFFIKPNKPLPKYITEITNITEADLINAISQEEGIKKIREILDNSIAVAHNANFDINFVNEKIRVFNLPKLDIEAIDTLIVARIINPDAKKFRLENLATRLNINYDSTVAHRADYDANVLAQVWLSFLRELEQKNINSSYDLEFFELESLHEKKFSYEVVIYAKNQKGLKELFKLISDASVKTFYNGPKLFIDKYQKSENLLLASGTLNSRLIDKLFFSTTEIFEQELQRYDVVFVPPLRDFVHWNNRNILATKDIKEGLRDLVYTAKKFNKKIIAVSDCRYIEENQKILHNIYINAKGLGGARHYLYKYKEENPIYPLQNFLTTDEMFKEFDFLEDFNIIKEIVVSNSRNLAEEFEEIQVIKDKLYAPIFDNSKENLEKLVWKTAKEKYGENLPAIVKNRLEKELNPILNYGFDAIYWISHKLVRKSLDDGYLVGSRGSVGSSLVATMAGITEVNPLVPHYICSKCKTSEFFEDGKYLSGFDLPDKNCSKCNIPFEKEGQTIPFETFLGFKADKVPDIDLNFSGEYQINIHNEVRRLFGENHTFRAGTISTNAEKTVYGYIKSQIEENLANYSSAFMEFLSLKAKGVKRTTGQHPGGIIVIPKEFDVEDFTPINYPANNDSSTWKTTHFDFSSIHDNVLKLDLLGHDDPTAIRMLENLTKVKATSIPKSDPKIISLFSSTEALGILPEDISGETTGAMGIPEFGTNFVRGMLKVAKAETFADLVAISGLSHGTDVWKGNAEELIVEKKLTFKDIVSCRDDIMSFLILKGVEPSASFKIMENVRKGKSLTKDEEDLLNKHNIPDWYIESLKKIKYLFPKAHATAYVLMAWRIAYYKLYYPLAYYATYFTTRADVSDIKTLTSGKTGIKEKIRELKRREFSKKKEEQLSVKEKDLIPILCIAEEMHARGFTISNVNLEKSSSTDWILDYENNALIPPFITIDGLGEAVAKSIEKAREESEFSSIEDLKNRTLLNKTLLEKIKEMGIVKHLNDTDQNSLF
ncbi:PolC-type DNA polymerase III [Mycoplasma sp. 613B]